MAAKHFLHSVPQNSAIFIFLATLCFFDLHVLIPFYKNLSDRREDYQYTLWTNNRVVQVKQRRGLVLNLCESDEWMV